ncbi:hypothetical protein D3C81_1650560 [compost metagenome]
MTHSVQAAELLTDHRRAAAQHFRRIKPTRRRQISPGSEQRLSELQTLAFVQPETAPRGQSLAVHPRAKIRPGQGQHAFFFSHHGESAEGDFDHRCIQSVAQ